MEYVDGGDLLDYVMSRQGLSAFPSPLSIIPPTHRPSAEESETREIALMVCEAVSYLHSQGVAHRDLKPENLLLSKGLRPLCKVTDFGLAKMVDNNVRRFPLCSQCGRELMYLARRLCTLSEGTFRSVGLADGSPCRLRTMCGTPTYLAPGPSPSSLPRDSFPNFNQTEVILADNRQSGYGNAVDAWSIGVVLYSCLTNATPFDESESTPLPERMAARRVDFDQVRENGVSETGASFFLPSARSFAHKEPRSDQLPGTTPHCRPRKEDVCSCVALFSTSRECLLTLRAFSRRRRPQAPLARHDLHRRHLCPRSPPPRLLPSLQLGRRTPTTHPRRRLSRRHLSDFFWLFRRLDALLSTTGCVPPPFGLCSTLLTIES